MLARRATGNSLTAKPACTPPPAFPARPTALTRGVQQHVDVAVAVRLGLHLEGVLVQ